MFDFTVQYLQDNDWIRITAIYENVHNCLSHAGDLLESGHVVRLLARIPSRDLTWHTIEWLDGRIILKRPVHYVVK